MLSLSSCRAHSQASKKEFIRTYWKQHLSAFEHLSFFLFDEESNRFLILSWLALKNQYIMNFVKEENLTEVQKKKHLQHFNLNEISVMFGFKRNSQLQITGTEKNCYWTILQFQWRTRRDKFFFLGERVRLVIWLCNPNLHVANATQ